VNSTKPGKRIQFRGSEQSCEELYRSPGPPEAVGFRPLASGKNAGFCDPFRRAPSRLDVNFEVSLTLESTALVHSAMSDCKFT
jgi:hypothetical protein